MLAMLVALLCGMCKEIHDFNLPVAQISGKF